MRTLIALLLVCGVLTGCGVRTQDRPEPITIDDSPTTAQGPTSNSAGPHVVVYFVRGDRLEGVRRSVPSPEVGTALAALVSGPSRQEVVSGLRTAVAPLDLTVTRAPDSGPTVSIDVTREFTGVAGGSQLLAVAQVVWTVTEFPGIRRVRLTAEGTPLEIPTDDGLTDGSVDRDDFRSVADLGGEPPPIEPEQTPATPSTTAPGTTAPAPTTPPAGSTATATGRRPPTAGGHRHRRGRGSPVFVTGSSHRSGPRVTVRRRPAERPGGLPARPGD